jgi:hypothetical protein
VSNDTETEDGDDETPTTLKPIGKVSAKGQELLNNPIFKKKLKKRSVHFL